MPRIFVSPHPEYCPQGALIETTEGTTVCDALLSAGVEIDHACGKVGACTTCHVILAQGASSLVPPSDAEDDMLDRAWGLHPQSRLACQAVVGRHTLVVEIPMYSINHARENV